MDFWDRLGIYTYVLALGVAGGILSIFQKKKLGECKNGRCWIGGLLLGIATSVFAGYVGYEIANFIFANEKLSLAISCICAWAGTDGLLAVEQKAIDILSRKIGGGRDDFRY
ncbi:phage holin family protein [Campylobacter hyointestinalis]|uniref:Holin n=1 Tax=Campylobacter hyointestinalis subsp. hyointestinalis TaxID=91352 RepID=A0A9W5AM33_CAMHY|nr:phage holin family protein [Campylobacter hyointestinalis]CUU74380.1 Uncharacterised protein [Campylobacter hyointestinalis subsp. hyointestinalis]CUU82171.1 Uncharacterised protein [Campylobacter hyointestinalis subsp. hyointestinalis]